MLIRSQDKKELHNLERIAMIRVVKTIEYEYIVEVNRQKNIGVYSTEEKAIKVLDMIQKAYKGNRVEEVYHEGSEYFRPVFQMPQDSEV